MKEDQILIEQLNASSIEAFSALYDKYAGMVFNFTHAILKDTYLSEDIMQSCFALMWIRRTSISPEGLCCKILVRPYNRLLHSKT